MKVKVKTSRICLKLKVSEVEAIIRMANLAGSNEQSTMESRIEADSLERLMKKAINNIEHLQRIQK